MPTEFVHQHDLYAALTDAAVRQRDAEAIQRFAPVVEQLAAAYGHNLYQAVAQRAWGVLHLLTGDYAQADARLRGALDQFEALGTRWQIGRTLADIGELAASRGDRADAQDAYARALEHFEALGARPDADRTRAALDSL